MTALPAATDFTGAGVTEGGFKTAITDLRAYLAGLLGAGGSVILAPDGALGAPGYSFANDTDCGMYRVGANQLGIAVGGVKQIDIATNGVSFVAIAAVSGKTTLGGGSGYNGGTDSLSVGNTTNDYTATIGNSHASSPNGVYVNYSAAAPNGTGNYFADYRDNSAARFQVRSNGGLANFSANNVNLCDIDTKSVHVPYTDEELDALEAAYVSVDWGKNKYKDQSHDDWNFGYSAQGVRDAFAVTVPTMTDAWNPTKRVPRKVRQPRETVTDDGRPIIQYEDVEVFDIVDTPADEQLLAVYEHDLANIGQALLARALKRIAVLEEKAAP